MSVWPVAAEVSRHSSYSASWPGVRLRFVTNKRTVRASHLLPPRGCRGGPTSVGVLVPSTGGVGWFVFIISLPLVVAFEEVVHSTTLPEPV